MISVGGYKFKNNELLNIALTHSSYSQKNYERLEFLGDSILDFLVAKHFFANKNLKEGELTKLRAFYVSEKHQSKVFDKILIEKDVRLGKSCSNVSSSIKCDVVEAIIGAIYLDSNILCCEKFIEDNFALDENTVEIESSKTRLQEYAQSKKSTVEYHTLERLGQSHNPTFIVECVFNTYKATEQGKSKQQAEENCAKEILAKIFKETSK